MSKEIYPIGNYMSKPKDIYKGNSTIVNVCCYKLVSIGKKHVLEYLLRKNTRGKLCFPQYNFDYTTKTKTIKDFTRDTLLGIFKEDENIRVESVGIKEYKKQVYCFLEVRGMTSLKEEKKTMDTFWFANMYDILNNRSLYMHKIDSDVYSFFYKNKEFTKLNNNDALKTFYKKISNVELTPFLVFDYIHNDGSSELYSFSNKCPLLRSGDVILKYVYLSDDEVGSTVVLTKTTSEDNYDLLRENDDVLILKRDGISLKTNGRVNLNLYSYYVKK